LTSSSKLHSALQSVKKQWEDRLYSGYSSASVLMTSANGIKSGSAARYHPFGSYGATPTQTISDRRFTGHAHNDDPSAGLYSVAKNQEVACQRTGSATGISTADQISFPK
jgi:hypothetical protein